MENQQPSQSQYPQYIQCPRCGAYNYSNAQFCQNCHLPFYQPYQTPQPEQNRQFSSEQPVSERIPQDTFTAQKPKKKETEHMENNDNCFGCSIYSLFITNRRERYDKKSVDQ